MNIDRLKMMVTMLEEVEAGTWEPSLEKPGVADWLDGFGSPRGFYIGSWGEEVQDLHEPCGFTACAVGHAALDDRFPELTAYAKYHEMYVVVEGHDNNNYIMPALAEYFGIAELEASKLFLGEHYVVDFDGVSDVTAGTVASRVNRLLNGEEI